MDREKLHVAIQKFVLDNATDGIKEPSHSLAYSLGVSVLIITASKTTIKNINMCVATAGYDTAGVILKTFLCPSGGHNKGGAGAWLCDNRFGCGNYRCAYFVQGRSCLHSSDSVGRQRCDK